MKTQKSNNFISAIFGSRKISRVVLMAYILVPIFLFAVGFASWTIVTPEFGFFTNGGFVGNKLLDSTRYIKLNDEYAPFTNTYMVGGFTITNDEGEVLEVLDTSKFTINFIIKLGQCKSLFTEAGANDEMKLYFTFSLCFADRTESTTLFNVDNFTYSAKLSTSPEYEDINLGYNNTGGWTTSEQDIAQTGVKVSNYVMKSSTNTIETSTSGSYVFVLVFNFEDAESSFGPTSEDSTVTLSIDYKLTPQSATIYRELMDIILGVEDNLQTGETNNQKSLMSDVRITDYNPY